MLDMKFQILSEKFGKDVRYEKGAKPLAGNVDSSGRLGVTHVLGAVFYNDDDGNLKLYREKTRSEFNLGGGRFIGTNFEGLGVVIQGEGNLIFWERKNLQNLMIPLAKRWESADEFRSVLITRGSVFFTAPDGIENHDLFRYDYIKRKVHPLLKGATQHLVDARPDGKRLLLASSDGAPYSIVEGKTGKILDVRFPDPTLLDPKGLQIFGFTSSPDEFIATKGGAILILSRKGKKIESRIISGKNEDCCPEAFNPSRSRLLYSAKGCTYYVLDLKTRKEKRVNQSPLIMVSPCFSEDGKGIYYIRFDGLFCAPI
jgi:hypothetical protein